jgi:hypothetical protein
MRNERKPSAVGARRIPGPGPKIACVFILAEIVIDLLALPNDGTCSRAFVLRFNDRPAPRSWRREARR